MHESQWTILLAQASATSQDEKRLLRATFTIEKGAYHTVAAAIESSSTPSTSQFQPLS